MTIFTRAQSRPVDKSGDPPIVPAAGTGPAQPRRRWGNLWSKVWSLQNGLRLIVLIVLLGAWSLTARHLVSPIWISSPSRVATRMVNSFGQLVSDAWVTIQEAMLGLAIGTTLGLVCGIILARAPRYVRAAIDPYILAAYSVPRIALAPFFLLWFGIGIWSKVILVVTVVGFVVFFNVRQGIEGLDRDMVDALRSMQASRYEMTRYLVVPAVVPWLLAGVKIGVGMAIVSAVVGEIIGSTRGLGHYLTRSINTFDMTGGFVAMFFMASIAMLSYWLVSFLERRLVRWQVSAGDIKETTTKL